MTAKNNSICTKFVKKTEKKRSSKTMNAPFEKNTTTFAEKVYSLVKIIPAGRVTTYNDIALALGNKKLCRAIGNALHKNPNENEIPCFRVVNSKGMLSKHFAFGGLSGQREKLQAEGIQIENNTVDLNKYGFNFSEPNTFAI